MNRPLTVLLISILTVFNSSLIAQQGTRGKQLEPVWIVVNHESKASFRGVHVAGDGEAIWVSGSKGTVLRSPDGGESWIDVCPDGAEMLDFRDIHGFGSEHAVALAIGSPGKIYRAKEGGLEWDVVFEDNRPEIFFDAMSFWDDENGIAFSDPIKGKLVIIRTKDGGRTWTELDFDNQPATIEGEGGFAASGTCLCINGENVFIGLGGARKEDDPENARMLMSPDRGETWTVIETPMKSGAASGIFSIAFVDDDHGVAVGGTYDNPEDATNNICITEDGGRTWFRPDSTTRGYRSCVVVLSNTEIDQGPHLIAVGKTGTDHSDDLGITWKPLDDQGFYAADSCNRGSLVIAVGAEGRIGILPINELELD